MYLKSTLLQKPQDYHGQENKLIGPTYSLYDVTMSRNPKIVLLFSGKRKSGKDYITDRLHARLGDTDSKILRIAGPIKHQFAVDNGLDYNQLLNTSDYKEKYRVQMISWSQGKRDEDESYFVRAAIEMYEANEYPIWIVSDVRRYSDLDWFRQNYGDCVTTIRISASEEVRKQRGWVFTHGGLLKICRLADSDSVIAAPTATRIESREVTFESPTVGVQSCDEILNEVRGSDGAATFRTGFCCEVVAAIGDDALAMMRILYVELLMENGDLGDGSAGSGSGAPT